MKSCLLGVAALLLGLAALPCAAQMCSPPPDSVYQCPPPGGGSGGGGGGGGGGTIPNALPGLGKTLENSGNGCTNCAACSIGISCGGGGGSGGSGGSGGGGGGGGGGVTNPNSIGMAAPPVAIRNSVREAWFAQDGSRSGTIELQVALRAGDILLPGAEVRALELDFVDSRDALTTLAFTLVRDPASVSGWRARLDGSRLLGSASRPLRLELPARGVAAAPPVTLRLDWATKGRGSVLELRIDGAAERLALPPNAVPAAMRAGVLAQNEAARRSPPYQVEVLLQRLLRDGRPAAR